ncbi:MAG: uracil-DNA glycosylase [Alphaproteobacteria bacterium]
MTLFQKLSWMQQMGIRVLCGEKPHAWGGSKPVQTKTSIPALEKKVQTSKSALSATATHPIGGVGVIPAKVLCILEMPSANEDRTGVALSGPEGELLKKMLSAIGLDTAQQTHVAYLSPWRSPGARVLTTVETQEGLNLLKQRIQAVRPQVLLLFGMPVVRAFLNLPLGQARGKRHTYQGRPVFATFAPNFLMKNDAYKRQAWADLKKLDAFLKENP